MAYCKNQKYLLYGILLQLHDWSDQTMEMVLSSNSIDFYSNILIFLFICQAPVLDNVLVSTVKQYAVGIVAFSL